MAETNSIRVGDTAQRQGEPAQRESLSSSALAHQEDRLESDAEPRGTTAADTPACTATDTATDTAPDATTDTVPTLDSPREHPLAHCLAPAHAPGQPDQTKPFAKICLQVSAAHAAALASLACRAGMSRSHYVSTLIEGVPAAPRPPDHAQLLPALMMSTDRLAVLSGDLNAFLRQLGHSPADELERYRLSLRCLVEDVRKHLALAATLVGELRPARRRRL